MFIVTGSIVIFVLSWTNFIDGYENRRLVKSGRWRQVSVRVIRTGIVSESNRFRSYHIVVKCDKYQYCVFQTRITFFFFFLQHTRSKTRSALKKKKPMYRQIRDDGSANKIGPGDINRNLINLRPVCLIILAVFVVSATWHCARGNTQLRRTLSRRIYKSVLSCAAHSKNSYSKSNRSARVPRVTDIHQPFPTVSN